MGTRSWPLRITLCGQHKWRWLRASSEISAGVGWLNVLKLHPPHPRPGPVTLPHSVLDLLKLPAKNRSPVRSAITPALNNGCVAWKSLDKHQLTVHYVVVLKSFRSLNERLERMSERYSKWTMLVVNAYLLGNFHIASCSGSKHYLSIYLGNCIRGAGSSKLTAKYSDGD